MCVRLPHAHCVTHRHGDAVVVTKPVWVRHSVHFADTDTHPVPDRVGFNKPVLDTLVVEFAHDFADAVGDTSRLKDVLISLKGKPLPAA